MSPAGRCRVTIVELPPCCGALEPRRSDTQLLLVEVGASLPGSAGRILPAGRSRCCRRNFFLPLFAARGVGISAVRPFISRRLGRAGGGGYLCALRWCLEGTTRIEMLNKDVVKAGPGLAPNSNFVGVAGPQKRV